MKFPLFLAFRRCFNEHETINYIKEIDRHRTHINCGHIVFRFFSKSSFYLRVPPPPHSWQCLQCSRSSNMKIFCAEKKEWTVKPISAACLHHFMFLPPHAKSLVFMNSRKRREARRSRTRSIYRLLLDRALSFPPCFVVLFSCVRIDYRTSRRERDRERDNARVPPCTRTLLPAKAAEPAGRPWRVSQVSLRGLPSIYFTVGAPIDQNLVEDPFIMSGWTTSGPAGR